MSRVKKIQTRIVTAGLLAAACVLAVTGCNDPWNPAAPTTPLAPPGAQVVSVMGQNGVMTQLAQAHGQDVQPVIPQDKRLQCGMKVTWSDHVRCYGGDEYRWYRDGIANAMAPYMESCGIRSYADIIKLANKRLVIDKNGQKAEVEVDARAVFVFNDDDRSVTDDQARQRVRDEIRKTYGQAFPGQVEDFVKAVDTMPVLRHDNLVNSMGLEKQKVTPFADEQVDQVRLGLTAFDIADNKVTPCAAGELDSCGNWWGTHKGFGPPVSPSKVPPSGSGTPPTSSPPTRTSPPTSPPGTTSPPTTTRPPDECPPGTNPPNCTVDKIPGQIPGQPGAAGDGGAGQYGGVGQDPPRTADPEPAPPSAGPEPSVYAPPPAAPAPEPAPAAPPVQTTRDPNPPTVAPSTQPPNHGAVPTTGCNNPDFC